MQRRKKKHLNGNSSVELVFNGSCLVFGDTRKSARTTSIGQPVELNSPPIHGVEFRELHALVQRLAPDYGGLPKGTQIAYFVMKDNSYRTPPSVEVQYFRAKR